MEYDYNLRRSRSVTGWDRINSGELLRSSLTLDSSSPWTRRVQRATSVPDLASIVAPRQRFPRDSAINTVHEPVKLPCEVGERKRGGLAGALPAGLVPQQLALALVQPLPVPAPLRLLRRLLALHGEPALLWAESGAQLVHHSVTSALRLPYSLLQGG